MDSLLTRISTRIEDPNLRNSTSKYRTAGVHIYPPTDLATIDSAEVSLGFGLPDLLREIYLHIANGGIGPGYGGIYGLSRGSPAYDGHGKEHDLVSIYHLYRGSGAIFPVQHNFAHGSLFSMHWLDRLRPKCAWGDDMYSCIDCSKDSSPVLFYVAYGGEFSLHSSSFESWIEEWLSGIDLWKKVMG